MGRPGSMSSSPVEITITLGCRLITWILAPNPAEATTAHSRALLNTVPAFSIGVPGWLSERPVAARYAVGRADGLVFQRCDLRR